MLDVETDAYIHCVSAFVKLAQSEYQLLMDIIPEHHQKRTFDSLIQVLPCPPTALSTDPCDLLQKLWGGGQACHPKPLTPV